VSGQLHAPVALHPGKEPSVPIGEEECENCHKKINTDINNKELIFHGRTL
jgi:hypothetical protein